jgi:hypothetical protein
LFFGMANWLTDWYRPDGPLSAEDVTQAILTLAFEGAQRHCT